MEKPVDFHEDLTDERLNRIAQILIDARNETVELFDPDGGDTNWGLGCRIYDRSRSRIREAEDELDWLTIHDPSLQLVFSIGNVPVRFYRGGPEEPTTNTLAMCSPELQQLSLAFPGSENRIRWRFAIDAEPNGEVMQVWFIGLYEPKDVVCKWLRTPDDEAGYPVEIRSYEKGEGVELDQPAVSIPKREKPKSTEEK